LWSEKTSTVGTTTTTLRDHLIYSKTIVFTNSDDIIRLPIETYYDLIPEPVPPADALPDAPIVTKANTEYIGFMRVLIYPPQEYPQRELEYILSGVTFYAPEPDLAPVVVP